jgi:hypothetical protein
MTIAQKTLPKGSKNAAKLVLLEPAVIGKMVDAAIKHTLKGDAMIHEAALQCMLHAAPKELGGTGSGDTTLADRLIQGLGKSVRVQALKLWFHDFSPIRWNGDGKVGQLRADAKDFKPYNPAMASENPFFSYAPGDERTARPISIDNILKIVDGLDERITRAVEKEQFSGDATAAFQYAKAMQAFSKSWIEGNHFGDAKTVGEVVAEGDKRQAEAPKAAPRVRAKKAA